MSITSEISRLQTAKAELKTSIENKGVSVPASAKLDNYHQYVDAIPTGSTIHNQDKVVDPNETQQVVTYDSNYTGLGTVTVEPISSTYVGSEIARRSSADLTASGAIVSVPSGYYENNSSKAVTSGMIGNPNLVRSKDNSYFYETISYPNFQEGYITTAPTVQTHLALENKTVTPSENSQTVNPTGNSYYLDSVTVNPIPSQYIVPTGTKEITANATGIDVTQYASVDVAVPGEIPNLQDKSVSYTPTETAQSATVTYDSGYTGLNEVAVSVGAISSDYVGSNITRRSSSDLSTSGATVTAPSGYYSSNASATVDSGVQGSPHWNVSKGTTTLSANVTFPNATAGYYNTVKGAGYGFTLEDYEVTPTETAQVITPTANSYYVNSVTINAIPSNYVGSAIEQRSSSDLTVSGNEVTVPAGYYANNATGSVAQGTEGTPTAVKSAVSNHSVSVIPSVTNVEGYISGGTHTGTAVSVTASELVSGTKSISENGLGIDVTNYASVDVQIPSPTPILQDKTVNFTPTESAQSQTVTCDSGYDGLDEVEINVSAVSSTYVGSEIPRKDSTDLTASGATVSVPAGYYAESASKSVGNGSAATPATTITANPTISINTTTGVVTATTSATQNITPTVSAGYVSSGTAGTVTVSGSQTSQLTTQSGTTINPTESEQTAVAANRYTLGAVKVGAISSTYVGSDIPQNDSTDLTESGGTVSVPAGYYATNASKSVPEGSASTPATTISVTPSISINSTTGVITATANGSKSITPTVSAGYVSSGTAGTVSVSGSNTSQLTTQAGTTITPTESEQTAVAANRYTTGIVKVGAISSSYVGSGITRRDSTDLTSNAATVTVPAGYYSESASKTIASGTAGTPVATKGTVSNHSVSITPSVTNTAGYIAGATLTGTAISVSASELVSGTLQVEENNTYDVTNYASVEVNIPAESVIINESLDEGGGTVVDIVGSVVYNQSKTVTPSAVTQIITPDEGYNGMSEVQINPISTLSSSTTNSSATSTQIAFTGLPGLPAAFFMRCITALTRNANNAYYYVADICYDGTYTRGNCWNMSTGQISNITSGYSYTYNNGTLTISSSGSQSTSPGSFYNGTYTLIYIY